MKKCPHCGEEMDEDLTEKGICSECGEEFDQNETEEDHDQSKEVPCE